MNPLTYAIKEGNANRLPPAAPRKNFRMGMRVKYHRTSETGALDGRWGSVTSCPKCHAFIGRDQFSGGGAKSKCCGKVIVSVPTPGVWNVRFSDRIQPIHECHLSAVKERFILKPIVTQ